MGLREDISLKERLSLLFIGLNIYSLTSPTYQVVEGLPLES